MSDGLNLGADWEQSKRLVEHWHNRWAKEHKEVEALKAGMESWAVAKEIEIGAMFDKDWNGMLADNKRLREALEKIKVKHGFCIYGTSDLNPVPEEAFRQGSHYAFNECAEMAKDALDAKVVE